METTSKLIAVVGGSGAGKSWLVDRLCAEFSGGATGLSLDDFYCDLSHLRPSDREKINFDYPEAIDWVLFDRVLRTLREGLRATLPRYDFVSHTRLLFGEIRYPTPIIFVGGLWLLWPEHIRELFDLKIFLDCPETVRWERRLARDLRERGRTAASIHKQFWNVVAPMHEQFVEAQKVWADLVIEQPTSADDLHNLVATIRALGTPLAKQLAEVAGTASNTL